MLLTIYVTIILTIALLIWLWFQFKNYRRKKLYEEPLKPEWIELLKQHVALYSILPNDLRQQLHGHINYFLNDKEFVGCDGQEITDDIRLAIAGNACLLVLQRSKIIFPDFKTILVYPSTYIAQQVSYDGLVQVNKDSTRAGESWYRGPIVLSWSDVLSGSLNGYDGHNVVLHEFAHKLDEENQAMNGLPVLRKQEHYSQWVEVLNQEYNDFLKRVDRRKNSVIDEYGAVSPPEFFAVATESFFEKSVQMKRKLPDLYKQLQQYYAVDPAEWRVNSQE